MSAALGRGNLSAGRTATTLRAHASVHAPYARPYLGKIAMSATPPRSHTFEATPAVIASRERRRFVDCPSCGAPNASYLHTKAGVRFVRCDGCGTVFTNPVPEHRESFLNMEESAKSEKLSLVVRSFARLLEQIEDEFRRTVGRSPKKIVLCGKQHPAFLDCEPAKRMGLQIVCVSDEAFADLHRHGKIDFLVKELSASVDVLILHELFEATCDARSTLDALVPALGPDTWLAVTYTNADSLPARVMRRHWAPFFDHKSAFFSTGSMTALLARYNYVLRQQFALPTTRTLDYATRRVAGGSFLSKLVKKSPLGQLPVPIVAGTRVALFRKKAAGDPPEKLSIVFPVYNEAVSCAQVIDGILAKELRIEKELIIVESLSTDGTREIVKRYESVPGVKVVYEEVPKGKGHAVRTGLAHATGSIVLIQDADFEYDLDDYDALIEPILQRRTNFVLGSRSLGIDDWKVRKFATGKAKEFVLNAAQLLFAGTYNALYQQKATDINTMFKVFRTECLDGITLKSDGFELDIELVCKLTKNGNAPLEIPVNYVARSFEEGKKISFIRDSFPSYFAIFRHRFA